MKNNWPVKKLGEVALYFNDGNWIESDDQSNEGFRLIQTGNVGLGFFKDKDDKARFISEETFKRLKCTEIFEGDILISRLPDPVGRSCMIPKLETRAITAVDCTITRFPTKLLAKYFQYFSLARYYFNEISKYLTGSSRVRISRANLAKVNILLPSTSIQKKIVERLDGIRKAQELCDQQIKKTEELFESIDVLAFKDGETHKLGELFTRQTKTILPTRTPNRDFNFIGLENIESNTSELVNFKTSKGKEIKSNKFFFQKGNILYGKLRPYLNKVWLTEFDGICSTDIWVLQVNADLIESLILATLLKSNLVVSRMSTVMTGTNLPRANASSFDSLEVKIPKLKEQQKIVEKLEAVQNYKKLLLKQKELHKELFDSVLDKSMKGEMDN